MNKTLANNTPQSYRFRRWKRAGYAAFASLAVAVTIGVLSAGVAEKSLLKSNTLSAEFSQNNVLQFIENESVEEILQELVAEIVITEQTSDIAAAGKNEIYIKTVGTYKNVSAVFFVKYPNSASLRGTKQSHDKRGIASLVPRSQ
ncbi:MAG: hypothetical protein LBN23_02245 [Paludibacter sp.]|jgi:hypothetical protein|nr:hypothetical protein [Paludibacter sp.]